MNKFLKRILQISTCFNIYKFQQEEWDFPIKLFFMVQTKTGGSTQPWIPKARVTLIP